MRQNRRIIRCDACDHPAPGAFVANLFRSRRRLEIENLFLRHQLNIALGSTPRHRRLRGSDRVLLVWMTWVRPSLLVLSRVVRPDTILRWHPNRVPMSKENPLWGAPRIHGFEPAESTVSKYIIRCRGPPSQTRQLDLCVVPTLTFERLFVFLVLGHGRRQLVWFAVARHPTAEWLAQQVVEAFPWNTAPTYLVRDNDRAYGPAFTRRVRTMGIRGFFGVLVVDNSIAADRVAAKKRKPFLVGIVDGNA
jgi:hypothetical protein